MSEDKLLPKPKTDLPLPEKELPSHASNTPQTSFLKSKFFLGFMGASFLVAFLLGGFFISKDQANKKASQIPSITQSPPQVSTTDWLTHNDTNYSIKYPKDYQLNENKIVATEGIIDKQPNTIQLISPTLSRTNGNLSIIIAYKPVKVSLEKDVNQSSTCAELSAKKLTPIKLGNNIFSTSGLINCGPNQVAFFYILNDGNIYEAKVETTANYGKDALPVVKHILSTLKFRID